MARVIGPYSLIIVSNSAIALVATSALLKIEARDNSAWAHRENTVLLHQKLGEGHTLRMSMAATFSKAQNIICRVEMAISHFSLATKVFNT